MVPHAQFAAEYTDGESARLQKVMLTLTPSHLTMHLQGDTGSHSTTSLDIPWSLADVVMDVSSPPLTRITRKSQPLAAITLHDPHFAAALKRAQSGLGGVHLGKGTQLVGLAVLVLVMVSGVWVAVNPISRRIAHKIPFAWEKEISGSFVARFREKDCGDDASNAILVTLKQRIIGESQLPFDTRLMIVRDNAVNAFALPGGLIIINRGLIAKAGGPDELAGVLAHELQHVIQRHITASLVRSGILTGLWQITLGDFTGVLAADPHTIMQVASLKFDRQAETDADRGAIRMLDQSGISRKGFEAFFERVGGGGKKMPPWLSSHPAHEDRLSMLRRTKGPESTRPSLSEEQWQILKQSCPKGEDEEDDDGDDGDT